MFGKIALAGATAAAILGVAGVSLAASGDLGSSTTAGSPATATGQQAKHPGLRKELRNVVRATVVTRDGTGFVTHDLIRGTAGNVSSTSITVTAADHSTETFTVTAATKVRVRTNGKGAAGTIADVYNGDTVYVTGIVTGIVTGTVAGTGTATPTAVHVIDIH